MNNFTERAERVARKLKSKYPNAISITVFNDDEDDEKFYDHYQLEKEIKKTKAYYDSLIEMQHIKNNPIVWDDDAFIHVRKNPVAYITYEIY